MKLTDGAEVLLRQVYPTWLEEDGEPSSQSFVPFRDVDEGKLSVDRSSVTTPADSHALFTAENPAGFGRPSAGVWGVSVDECAALVLPAHADPVAATADTPANPAHALIDFAAHSKSKRQKLGRLLKARAIARRRLHPAAA